MNHHDVSGKFKNVHVIMLFDMCWSSCYMDNILKHVLSWVSATSIARKRDIVLTP